MSLRNSLNLITALVSEPLIGLLSHVDRLHAVCAHLQFELQALRVVHARELNTLSGATLQSMSIEPASAGHLFAHVVGYIIIIRGWTRAGHYTVFALVRYVVNSLRF